MKIQYLSLDFLLSLIVLWSAVAPSPAQDQAIYTDSLQNGWMDWGWATINYNNSSPVCSGSKSVAVTITDASWQAIYIAHAAFNSSGYSNLTFWINGGPSGGQQLMVAGVINSAAQNYVNLPPLAANTWQKYSISLAALGVANRADMGGIWIQDRIGAAQPTFYVDDIVLTGGATVITNTAVTVAVDAQLNRHPINPLIYGIAYGSSNALTDLNCPLNRSGGNNTSRYNWQLNADNRGNDWYYESIADTSAVAGERGDTFIASSRSAGAQAMLTIPAVGWVAKVGANRSKLASFSIAKYGAQTGSDSQWFPDAGNGILSNGKYVTGNAPADANVPADSLFQQAWVQHIVSAWGPALNGGLGYYIFDNEPSIWHATHRDVHPTGATMDEVRNKLVDYAAKIKAVDPTARVVGPEEWGWSGYFYSGYDQQYGSLNGWSSLPDRQSHGNADYLPWLLNQMSQYQQTNGQRLLDVFSVHYYPQSGEFGNDTSSTMQLLRNQSTRSLWDPNYVDQSWIGTPVQLIPRIKNWVTTYYPGTAVAVTEYNWGAEAHINGAIAQADIFGIFGREGLDLATRWTTPDAATPTYKAMKLYRNYDGAKSGFGDTSVTAIVPNPDNVSAYAALRSSDGALTILVINKQLGASATTTANLANFTNSGVANVWQLTSANTISKLSDIAVSGSSFSATVPAQSISLFVLPASAVPPPPVPTISSFTPTSGPIGTSVTVAGSNLSSTTNVTFNGTKTTFTVVSSTQITAPVPAGATTGKISVRTPLGLATSAGSFTVVPSPAISSFSPVSGPVGTKVTINGSGYAGTVTVKFNGTASSSVTLVSSVQLAATVPTGATTGLITVTTAGGTATTGTAFTVLAVPSISSFTPTSGGVGTSVTLTGANLLGATAVKFNGTTATFTVISSTKIVFGIPTGAKTGNIAVTTAGGTATSSSKFTVGKTAVVPAISSFSPTSGPAGTVVTVVGTNLGGATAVKLGTISLSNFTVVSAGSLSFVVPAGTAAGKISVTTAGGTGTSSASFN